MTHPRYVRVRVDLTMLYLTLKAWLLNRPLTIQIIDGVEV